VAEDDWRLKAIMRRQKITPPELQRRLADMGEPRSRSQIYRLIAAKPHKISLDFFLTLCDVLRCAQYDLAPRKRKAKRSNAQGRPLPPRLRVR
jgi:DNA-binding Xre family transcriptional regulator